MTQNIDRKPNRLAGEQSPYLLQHAHNPVDWYPWGEEAWEKARSEDKPVFLSIGYATCHWCHVMERESFEDDETAALLNKHFVAIKVDREERPDIDSIYMDAIHAMGKQGGWPLNLFLTPEKLPITGGTYFPPVSRYGMRSFKDILQLVADAWLDRNDELRGASRDFAAHLRSITTARPDAGLPSTDCFKSAYQTYDALYDPRYHGFKTDSVNKFPPSMALSFLIDYHHRTGSEKAIKMVEGTLCAMKNGGIYDQIGGGLCRYSTNQQWLVPHFEKMLYDNSLFLTALAECFQLTGKPFFRDAAYDVINYIRMDMLLPEGGIASAEDADSEGVEGKFYVWSLDEYREVAGDDSAFLENLWSVTDHGNFEGKNILHEDIIGPPLTHAEKWGEEKAESIRKARERLLERRSKRVRPLRDDKALTSWNCLYIQALVNAGLAFGDAELIDQAGSIHAFICENLIDANGRPLRRHRAGQSGIPGYLSDYAEMCLASLALFRATSNTAYITNAARLTEDAIRLFSSDFGPFYETGSDSERLLRRTINGYDGVEPSGNSSIAKALIVLAALGINDTRYNQVAEGIFRYFKDDLEKRSIGSPAMLDAYMGYAYPRAVAVLVGEPHSPEMRQSAAYLDQNYPGNTLMVRVEPGEIERLAEAVPVVYGKRASGDFTAYLCVGTTCQAPVSTFEAFRGIMAETVSSQLSG